MTYLSFNRGRLCSEGGMVLDPKVEIWDSYSGNRFFCHGTIPQCRFG
uniref:Uncharacterized protein n=1 Tax=Rhizophora mucronata TaxID=61149 RepID=A0A2P2P477_RHIMU